MEKRVIQNKLKEILIVNGRYEIKNKLLPN